MSEQSKVHGVPGPLIVLSDDFFTGPDAGKCKTCRHWDAPQSQGTSGECWLHWAPNGVCAPNGLRVTCHEDPVLETGPDFGCVRWEQPE